VSPTKKRDHSSARGGQQQHDYYLDAALAWTGVLMEALFCCLITQPRRVRLNERAFLCFDLKLCCVACEKFQIWRGATYASSFNVEMQRSVHS